MASSQEKSGHVSRRNLLRQVPIMVGGAASLVTGSARAASLVPPQVAGYVATSPQDGQTCSARTHFDAPAACKLVSGAISPGGWCKLFAMRN